MIRLTKYLIGLLLLSLFSGCSVKSKIRKADKKYEIGEYYNAANIYNKAYPKVKLKDRQLKAYTAFKLGDCYRLTNLDDKAERAFANAVKFNYKDSIVFLYYADALRKNQKMKYAITLYDSYLATHPNFFLHWLFNFNWSNFFFIRFVLVWNDGDGRDSLFFIF